MSHCRKGPHHLVTGAVTTAVTATVASTVTATVTATVAAAVAAPTTPAKPKPDAAAMPAAIAGLLNLT